MTADRQTFLIVGAGLAGATAAEALRTQGFTGDVVLLGDEGDVANAYYPHLKTHLRLEHWSAALNQPPVAASTMLGSDAAYDHVPYFYSDQ